MFTSIDEDLPEQNANRDSQHVTGIYEFLQDSIIGGSSDSLRKLPLFHDKGL